MTRNFIKIFGERNTGTRALAQMLRGVETVQLHPLSRTKEHGQNQLRAAITSAFKEDWRKQYLDALRDAREKEQDPTRVWKHAAPTWDYSFVKEQARVIFLVRNPYSWALSMASKPYHLKGPRTARFHEFLNRPWMTERRDNLPWVLPNVMALWQEKIKSYQRFAEIAFCFGVDTSFIRFEDFMANPKAEAMRALTRFSIPPLGLEVVPVSTKQARKTLSEMQSFYGQEKWRARLTQATVALINTDLDRNLLSALGYARLQPSAFPEALEEAEARRFAYEMMNLSLDDELA